MKIIKDIRLYKSDIENISGNSTPSDLGNRSLNLTARRITMRLREQSFSLGDFDHLYLNFNTCVPAGAIIQSKRSVDRYHPWYRYYDIGVSREEFARLGAPDSVPGIIALIKQTLQLHFASEEDEKQVVEAAVEEAVSRGSEMLMRFKEKNAAKTKAIIYIQLLDSASYQPILSVCDLEGNELLRELLPQTIDFSSLGEIRLSSKKVTVKPRNNAFAQNLSPISFTF